MLRILVSSCARTRCYPRLTQCLGWHRHATPRACAYRDSGCGCREQNKVREDYPGLCIRPAYEGQDEKQTPKADSHSVVRTCLLSTRCGARTAVCRDRRRGLLFSREAHPAFTPGDSPTLRIWADTALCSLRKTSFPITLSRALLRSLVQPAREFLLLSNQQPSCCRLCETE